MAPVSVRSPSGVRPGQCSIIELCMTLTEDYGVLVGRTLVVDASKWSANVLMVNPSSGVVGLPSFSCLGILYRYKAAGGRNVPVYYCLPGTAPHKSYGK